MTLNRFEQVINHGYLVLFRKHSRLLCLLLYQASPSHTPA
jgi:hypothetical protein